MSWEQRGSVFSDVEEREDRVYLEACVYFNLFRAQRKWYGEAGKVRRGEIIPEPMGRD